MDENSFRKFLKTAGKKDHVADGLVDHMRLCEKYLKARGCKDINAVCETDIRGYVATLTPADVKKRMRALALYLKAVGNLKMATFASGIREGEIAGTRKAFKLGGFRGVDPAAIDTLAAIGVVTTDDLLALGATPQARRQLAAKTKIPATVILELVKLSDLSRLGAVKSVRARLYYEAGLDTPDKFTSWDADDLRRNLIEFVEKTGFDGIAPLPKELRNTIETARRLPKVVKY